jgi:S1-C subfamily serine protease
MRSPVVAGVVAAVVGSGLTAATLLGTGMVSTGGRQTVIQSSATMLASGPVGSTTAGDVYRSEAGGVVAVRSRAVPVPASAFDTGTRRPDGQLAGSGFVLDTDGHIVTAAHLVRAASDVRVTIGTRTVRATVLGVDEADDLAVLRVRPDHLNLQPLSLGDSDTVRVGDPAIALGRPAAALAPTQTSGSIAARQGDVRSESGARVYDALQLDADLPPGDCGGPLLDAAGEVTGVNTRMLTAEGDVVQIAIPSNTIRRVLAQLTGKSLKVVSG